MQVLLQATCVTNQPFSRYQDPEPETLEFFTDMTPEPWLVCLFFIIFHALVYIF